VSVIQNFLLATPEGYQISRSVRLRSSASAYLNRTLTTPTSGSIWTYSVWVKRGSLNSNQQLLSAGAAVSDQIYFQGGGTDKLIVYLGASQTTTQVFRDPSAWYHFVFAVDTTQATASNRLKIYLNGTQITAFDVTGYPTQNSTTKINSAVAHYIGRYAASASDYVDGYLTEVNFIDGRTPDTTTRVVNGVTQTILTELGEFNPVTDVWQPKKYTGTYGTNGFYLNFSDNSAATAAAIGKDSSGNGNNWTPNNITLSPTTSVSYDSMLDVPTQWADGGNGRGNYAVANPLDRNSSGTVADGNLKWSAGAAQVCVRGTFAIPSSGKWYMECVVGSASSSVVGVSFGLATANVDLSSSSGATGLYQLYASANRQINLNNSTTGSVSGGFSANDVLQIAVDVDNSKMWLGVNNTWYNSTYTANGDPATGANATSTTSMVGLFPFSNVYSNSVNWNFGQRPFTYTPPTGFKALNTLNLPTPTILKGNQYFDATTYTGNGSTQSIVNAGGFQPDLVWTKMRGLSAGHNLVDAVRGATKALYSNLTNAETTDTNGVTAFNANGFALGSASGYNNNGVAAVGWQWKEGATQGFDIVTYTGTGANRTVAHSLGVAPSMMIFKPRNAADNWPVWHKSFAVNEYVYLNLTNAKASLSTFMNSTLPNSSDITLGTWANTNANTQTMVCYAFSEVAGFSKFGSYTGNGSADGPMIFTGFLPRWVLIKCSSAAGTGWYVYDTVRNTYNVMDLYLRPDVSDAETTFTAIDCLSNGFKLRTSNSQFNGSGSTYVYAAFASSPFKNSLAR
jgi:hypothetical protein